MKFARYAGLLLAGLAVLSFSSGAGLADFRPRVGPEARAPSVTLAQSETCSSTSSISRRCHFTFAKECEKEKRSKDHCSQVAGYCHSCTDQYVRCKGRRNEGNAKCSECNAEYSACISDMARQYLRPGLLQ